MIAAAQGAVNHHLRCGRRSREARTGVLLPTHRAMKLPDGWGTRLRRESKLASQRRTRSPTTVHFICDSVRRVWLMLMNGIVEDRLEPMLVKNQQNS